MENYNVPKNKNNKVIILLIVIVMAILLILRGLATFKLDLTWFQSLGYESVFWQTFLARILFGLGVFLFAALLVFLNLLIIQKIARRSVHILISLAISLITAFVVVGGSAGLWLEYLKFANAQPFGIVDPQFGLDISFYTFKLPFLWVIYRFINIGLIANLVITVIMYLLLAPKSKMEVDSDNSTVRIFSGAEKRGLSHISIMLALIFAWQAVNYKLSTYELMYSQVGSVIGAGATDIGARLPAYLIMMIASLLVGALICLFRRKRFRLSIVAIGSYFVLMVVAIGIFPGLYQKFVVDPDELGREKPYLEHNIKYTRMAYGLDNITEIEYPVGELTAQDIAENRDIIDNIRILDHRATLSTYGQQQEIRYYYDFIDVDIDRYVIDDKPTQTMIAARELNKASLADQAKTFNNLMFKYTHGFGIVMSPATKISNVGLPEYLIKDIPPQSNHFHIKEPRIYFGETTNDAVIVNSGLAEFDYPYGEDNEEYTYQGDKGIPMTTLNKLFLAIREGEIKFLLSDYIKPDSLYLETRNILARVRRLAPFLRYDRDPYLVLGEDGKLYYLLDAYTVTDKYPYSQIVEGGNFNYIRNSVKVVIDAYSGQVDFYIFDQKDPIIQVYKAIYPTLFKMSEEFPAVLDGHLRYPEDLFNVQSMMLGDYHMSNPTVFYNREDRWELAKENYAGKVQAQEPYYSLIRLPGEESPEYIIMRLFNPSGKQNSVAWLAGRSDGENYGKLLLYKFPKGVQVPGTMQVEAQIDQDPNITGQLTLWGQGGSQLLRGNLLVYPLNNSLLYVEPLYIESEQNQFPQLKKVFVYYKDRVVMEDTLELALESIFGSSGAETEGGPHSSNDQPVATTTQELINRLVEVHNEAKEKLKVGDWAAYGRLQEEMDRIIQQLEEQE